MISYDSYQKGSYQVIKINKILDMNADISELEKIIIEFLEKNITKIAINFQDDSYLSSSAGAIIVRSWEAIKDQDGEMAFINVNKNILDFLSIIGFASVNKIFNSEDELETGV